MTILGIDLGTTNSLVAVLGPNGPYTIANELGDHLTPSAVAYAEDGSLLIGRAARDRLVVAPESGRAFFKRDMGTAAVYTFGKRSWTPTECSALVLRELRRVAEAHLGETLPKAVITVPAYFHDPQRLATLEAAKIAGLEVERILNEPTAAALAFGFQAAQDTERTLLVFDLGGGTFDVTVLEVFEGIVEVKASAGDSRLGGEDFTDGLLALAIQRLGGGLEAEDRARLRQRVEVAKRHLTERKSAAVAWGQRDLTLTQADIELVGKDLVARLAPLMRRCLGDAGLALSDIDDVLMVGGASRMPIAVDLVTQTFGRLPNRTLDPDRVVALGAAIQAARAERHEAVRDLVMTDVCPHSLGVDTTHDLGSRYEDGIFLPILDRNVTVPISRVQRLETLHPRQDAITMGVYQGENRRVKDNTLLGSLTVKGLKHRAGQKHPGLVDVRFSYDANGILEVEVTVVETGEKHVQVIERRPGALTKEQVRDAVARLQPVKTRAIDLLPNRARLERAHRLFSELTGLRRSDLEARLQEYERALEEGDPDTIGWSSARLDQALGATFADEGEQDPIKGPLDGDGPDGR